MQSKQQRQLKPVKKDCLQEPATIEAASSGGAASCVSSRPCVCGRSCWTV